MRLNDKKSRTLGELVQEVEYLETYLKAVLDSDLVLNVTPATLGSSAEAVNTAIAGDGFTRDVVCKLVDGNGDALTYFNGSLPISIAVDTAGTGDASLPENATSLTFVEGVATTTITYTGAWAEADTSTFTLGNTSSIAGVSLANKTSVDTLIA